MEILKFSEGREIWQQDYLRSMVTQTELTDQDMLLERLKTIPVT